MYSCLRSFNQIDFFNMLHPDTELRFVSDEIGYGIFATKLIPMGTITWVKDQLDRVFSKNEIQLMTESNRENLMKYTYRDRHGSYFFCWDLTRYVNHSYDPNSILTSLGFEIAIRDIQPGEELTNDYGTLNIIEPFKCANGPHEREFVRPDDLTRFYIEWDKLIEQSMQNQPNVNQPLSRFLTAEQISKIESINKKLSSMPSIIENYYKEST